MKLTTAFAQADREGRIKRNCGARQPTKPPKPRNERIVVPYGVAKFPTAEEVDRPHGDINAWGEHVDRYGRVPLHPTMVADFMHCESLVGSIGLVLRDKHPDADRFFECVERLLAHRPQQGKLNGLERDLARDARKLLKQLREILPAAIKHLSALQGALAAYDRNAA